MKGNWKDKDSYRMLSAKEEAEKMKNRRVGWLKSLILTAAIAAAAVGGLPVTVLAADKEIVVLYTNDVHCGVEDNIGYGGLSLYKKEMRQQTPYVTLVDTGDAIQGAPIGTLSDGGYLIDIMNEVGYDFAVPGNHEFDYGMARFLELAGKLDCGYYTCNFLNSKTGTAVFEPYKIFTYGDTKVAFVGVTTPESFTKSTPAYFQDAQGNYIYSFCEDESGQRLYRQIQASVEAARSQGADYVILAGHLGENGVTQKWSSTAVIANTTGIDACIDGHSHETVASEIIKSKDGRNVILTQTGTKLNDIGKLTISPEGVISTELVSKAPAVNLSREYTVQRGDSLSRIAKRELGDYRRWIDIYNSNLDKVKDRDKLSVGLKLVIPGGSYINEDGKAMDYATARFIQAIEAQYMETLKTVLGTTPYELTVDDPATGLRAVRNGETNLGDLTADAYRAELGADIGFSNGGGIRSIIKPGNITYNDTLAVFPYGNMGCVVEATGQQIKDALEMASRNYPEESGGFLQVSGISYTIDTSVKSSVRTDDRGNFTGVAGPYRVTDINVAGQPLDLTKTYTVASHNYMLKMGGDGMTMFSGCNVVKDEVMVDVDILSAYIRQLGGTVTARYAEPKGQGRIVIK